ncbi:MAG TPA: hypothetical protein VGH87_04330 [Polyangiaceae bacterium]
MELSGYEMTNASGFRGGSGARRALEKLFVCGGRTELVDVDERDGLGRRTKCHRRDRNADAAGEHVVVIVVIVVIAVIHPRRDCLVMMAVRRMDFRGRRRAATLVPRHERDRAKHGDHERDDDEDEGAHLCPSMGQCLTVGKTQPKKNHNPHVNVRL